MKKLFAFLLAITISCSACGIAPRQIPIKVLILPKFEIGEMTGDAAGEAQLYYERYLAGGDTYEIAAGTEGSSLYVKDGVALYVTGPGKVSSSLGLAAVLSDERFDFSDAYVLSTGCAGGAEGYSVMGDVFVITSAFDYDLGHHADPRDMESENRQTWFHSDDYDATSYVRFDDALTNRVYELVKDTQLKTTDDVRKAMSEAFDGAEWATRAPRVLPGTSATGDNYWKGEYDHQNALLMAQQYGTPDPYACCEMEDVAIAVTMRRYDMLDRLIVIRGAVNMDVFLFDDTPESLWDEAEAESLVAQDSTESLGLFPITMDNIFAVGSTTIDAILDGTL